MSLLGTAAYEGLTDLPPLVERAVNLARRDLLVLDGGGQGKAGGIPADPEALLRPGGTIVIDDLTPAPTWPPWS